MWPRILEEFAPPHEQSPVSPGCEEVPNIDAKRLADSPARLSLLQIEAEVPTSRQAAGTTPRARPAEPRLTRVERRSAARGDAPARLPALPSRDPRRAESSCASCSSNSWRLARRPEPVPLDAQNRS